MIQIPKKFIVFLIIVVIVFTILNFLERWCKFYYTISWYDKFLHFSAAICVILAIWWFMDILEKTKKINKKSLLFKIFISFLFLLAIAVLWEVFEFTIDKCFNPLPPLQPGVKDTLWDLFFDFLGGITAVLIIMVFRRIKIKRIDSRRL